MKKVVLVTFCHVSIKSVSHAAFMDNKKYDDEINDLQLEYEKKTNNL